MTQCSTLLLRTHYHIAVAQRGACLSGLETHWEHAENALKRVAAGVLGMAAR